MALRPGDVVLLDEAGMTSTSQMLALMQAASMAAQEGKIAQALTAYARHGAVHIGYRQEAALAAMAAAFRQAEGDAVAIAATNAQVSAINTVLREAAREIGIIGGQDVIVRAASRGQKGGKPKPVDLAWQRATG
jgi:hypothetical protein